MNTQRRAADVRDPVHPRVLVKVQRGQYVADEEQPQPGDDHP